MLSFEQTLNTVFVPEDRLNKTLDRIMGQTIREAARQWLRTIVVHVPVETGMAKGTLQPLGRLLRVAVNVRPTRRPYFSRLEGSRQSPAEGAAKTEFKLLDDKSNPGQFLYEFSWTTDVLHYWLGIFYNGPNLAGEQAIKRGEEAFFNHIQQALDTRVSATIKEFIQVTP